MNIPLSTQCGKPNSQPWRIITPLKLRGSCWNLKEQGVLLVASPHHIDGCMFHCILLYSVIFHYVPWLMPLPSYCNIPSYCIISTYSDGNIYPIQYIQNGYHAHHSTILHYHNGNIHLHPHHINIFCLILCLLLQERYLLGRSPWWWCKPPKKIQNIWYVIYDICDSYIYIPHDSYISW